MSFTKSTWDQLKNKTAGDLISALEKDGWALDEKVRTERIYRHPDGRRVSIHYHAGRKFYGPGLLKSLLDNIGWSESDMKRLKLVK